MPNFVATGGTAGCRYDIKFGIKAILYFQLLQTGLIFNPNRDK